MDRVHMPCSFSRPWQSPQAILRSLLLRHHPFGHMLLSPILRQSFRQSVWPLNWPGKIFISKSMERTRPRIGNRQSSVNSSLKKGCQVVQGRCCWTFLLLDVSITVYEKVSLFSFVMMIRMTTIETTAENVNFYAVFCTDDWAPCAQKLKL